MARHITTKRPTVAMTQEESRNATREEVQWKRFRAACFLSMAFFGSAYLYSMNRIAVQGYAIRSAEKRVAELRQENKQLQIQEAELRSLHRIEEAGQRLSMVEAKEVRYIEESNPLALR